MIKSIFFDLDDTLIDRDTAFREYLKFVLSKLPVFKNGIPLKEMDIIMKEDSEGRTDRLKFCQWLADKYELPISGPELRANLSTNLPNFISPYNEGLRRVLRRLSKKYELGIITNGGSQMQRIKLQKTGLLPLFDNKNIFIGGEIGLYKPDVEIFKHVIQQTQGNKNTTMFVGNHLFDDIYGAKEAGWKTCWLNSLNQPVDAYSVRPDYAISQIADIEMLFRTKEVA